MNESLHSNGEYALYRAANIDLDRRLHELSAKGVEISQRVKLLEDLRSRVTEVNILQCKSLCY
jgi:hypothetical protein